MHQNGLNWKKHIHVLIDRLSLFFMEMMYDLSMCLSCRLMFLAGTQMLQQRAYVSFLIVAAMALGIVLN
jgi:hypothetical protein